MHALLAGRCLAKPQKIQTGLRSRQKLPLVRHTAHHDDGARHALNGWDNFKWGWLATLPLTQDNDHVLCYLQHINIGQESATPSSKGNSAQKRVHGGRNGCQTVDVAWAHGRCCQPQHLADKVACGLDLQLRSN